MLFDQCILLSKSCQNTELNWPVKVLSFSKATVTNLELELLVELSLGYIEISPQII